MLRLVAAVSIGEGIRKTGEHAYRIERARADALRKDEAALRAVRVVPYVKDGEQVGLKLFAIRPSAVWAQLGLKNGDVVAAVNGRSLGSMDETMEMLEALENKRRFEIEILRRGKPVTLVWTVK